MKNLTFDGLIEIINLKKFFGKTEVLKNINLSIEAGKVTAIVGPNGSGKTTLIKSVLGLVKPSSGMIEVDGENINNNFTYRNKIGYMPQIARYPENLTANELLSLVKQLRNSSDLNAGDLIKSFKLSDELEKPFKNLSGGTKQKVSATIAFAFNPKIYFLDEPTAGLDPVSSSFFKDLVLKEKQNKKTIVLTSHIMSEVQELADEIVFLLEGEIRFKGTIDSLLQNQKETKLERAIAELMNEAMP
ncbi:MAG: copper ABC transporter ATP-binding protein [Ignavibacteria bacterium RIFOXYB2_FULL_35_12]|nr:MAG: copper ABC transporter ATP-binding protein [Ignavibacteria bacterium GWA2_36_19]OGU52652.1 MAG: copper ABC transporter ATP-binding protein [Ignavibacteria bacterium GWC2_35_8]OGU59466.1 MAG: copper ABC transporter ATP-binding protein [Ignavibacteria bacterium GWF2_35_20]OGU79969.1 MAG: copper ABC transporter ATP-binding protein [Ignavibacteria bacterium RIFOXYA2_FULL_35_9]OGU85091.1 MAG: copper ABC transporter ATP-binding protein [Ignavibacteria bacterium RIFOXYA12_FULL_35_25]OGU89334.